MGRKRVAEANAQAREAILEAAKRQYAEHGLEQSSVRTIAEAADVNSAMLGYYFGSKDALVRELASSISLKISGARLEALQDLRQAHGEVIPVRDLIFTFAEPYLDPRHPLAEVTRVYVRFMGRMLAEPVDDLSETIQTQLATSQRAYLDEIEKSASHVDPATLSVRFVMMMSAIPLLTVRQSRARSLAPALAAANVSPEPDALLALFADHWGAMLLA